jgi:predicted  nucleic acid-binding Zn-ribbon protein
MDEAFGASDNITFESLGVDGTWPDVIKSTKGEDPFANIDDPRAREQAPSEVSPEMDVGGAHTMDIPKSDIDQLDELRMVEQGKSGDAEALVQHSEAISMQLLDAEAAGENAAVAQLQTRLDDLSSKLDATAYQPDLSAKLPTQEHSPVPDAIKSVVKYLKTTGEFTPKTVEEFKRVARLINEEVDDLKAQQIKAASNFKSMRNAEALKPKLHSIQLRIGNYAATVQEVLEELVALADEMSRQRNRVRSPVFVGLIEKTASKFERAEDVGQIYADLKRLEVEKENLSQRSRPTKQEEVYQSLIDGMQTEIDALNDQLNERRRMQIADGQSSVLADDKPSAPPADAKPSAALANGAETLIDEPLL